MHAPPRRVQVDRDQAQATLEGPLHPAQALDLGQRDPIRDPGHPTGSGDCAPPGPRPGQVVVPQRRLDADPLRRREPVAGRLGHDPVQQKLGLPARADREHRPQGMALRSVLSLRALASRHVHLHPTPSERAPQERLDHPHRPLEQARLGPGLAKHLGEQVEAVHPDQHRLGGVERPMNERELFLAAGLVAEDLGVPLGAAACLERCGRHPLDQMILL